MFPTFSFIELLLISWLSLKVSKIIVRNLEIKSKGNFPLSSSSSFSSLFSFSLFSFLDLTSFFLDNSLLSEVSELTLVSFFLGCINFCLILINKNLYCCKNKIAHLNAFNFIVSSSSFFSFFLLFSHFSITILKIAILIL